MKTYTLNADEILQSAATESNLEQFIEPGIRERFSHMVGLLNNFDSLRADEYPAAVRQLKGFATMRLRVARDWAQYPEILDQTITQPFFVIGNARAGTTFTQMLLSWDAGHRTPTFRDARNPSPPPGLDSAADALALAEQDAFVRFMLEKSPGMLPAHPYLDQGGRSEAEDEFIYSLDFDFVYPLHLLNVANLPQTLTPHDPIAALRFHKNMLKQLQWKTPTRRWVGKGILHQYLTPALLEVYPDAVCFWIHRAPEEFIASLLALLELQYKPFNRGRYNVQPAAMVEQLRAGVESFLNGRSIDDPRIHHIRFRDLMKDPLAVIAPIYEQRGIAFTKAYEDVLRARLASGAYRADRYGKFEYSLEQFGLKREDLRRQFAAYCDRFQL